MFSILPILSIALAATSASGLIIPRHRAINLPARSAAPQPVASQPATYAAGYLESYETYHLRYTAVGCENKHSTTFFDKCCHPLLATENLKDNRAPECIPTAAEVSSASAALASSTAQPGDGGSDGCDGGDEPKTPATTSTTSAPAKNTAAPKNVGASPPKTTPKTTLKPKDKPSATTHTSTSSKPATTSSGGGGGLISGGFGTFFTQNGNAGACGKTHKDSDLICAIDQDRYGDSGKVSSLCGKQIKITNTSNKKSVTCTIADDCPTCKNKNSVDMSVGAFTQIATEAEGEVNIAWEFL